VEIACDAQHEMGMESKVSLDEADWDVGILIPPELSMIVRKHKVMKRLRESVAGAGFAD